MINHMAVAVVDGEDVAVANTVHMATGITMAEAVGINLIQAVVEAEAVVFLNHNTRPNQCAIGVEWITIGLRHVGLPDIFVTSIKRVRKERIQKPIWSIKMAKEILIKMILWNMKPQIA